MLHRLYPLGKGILGLCASARGEREALHSSSHVLLLGSSSLPSCFITARPTLWKRILVFFLIFFNSIIYLVFFQKEGLIATLDELKDLGTMLKMKDYSSNSWVTKEQKNGTKASLISLEKISKIHCLELGKFSLEVINLKEGNWPLEKLTAVDLVWRENLKPWSVFILA